MKCNVLYLSDSKNRQRLLINLKSYYRLFNRENNIEDIKSRFLNDYKINNAIQIQSDASSDFINDFINSITNLFKKQPPLFNDKERTFASSLFEAALEESSYETYISDKYAEIELKENIETQKLKSYDDAALAVYGLINKNLVKDAEEYFYNLLFKKIAIDTINWRRYSLGEQLLNERIVKFKNEKFKNLVLFLKEKYSTDSAIVKELNKVLGLYTGGILNNTSRSYVLQLFKKYLETQSDLNKTLRDEFFAKSTLEQENTNKYKKLVLVLKSDSTFAVWFNKLFKTNDSRNKAENQAYIGKRFTNYFKKILFYIESAIDSNTSNEVVDKANNILQEIIYPLGKLLNYVHDYFILTAFDDILDATMGDFVKMNSNFIKNADPQNQVSRKYMAHVSKKHQHAGWETQSDENSDTHTSVTVKLIFKEFTKINYKTKNVIPEEITVTDLSFAFQALLYDVLNNKLYINSDKKIDGKTSIEYIKYLLSSMHHNNILNTYLLMSQLFDGAYPWINSIVSYDHFNDNHRHILYSFYNQVLDLNNDSSILNLESSRIEYDSNGLELTSNIVGLLLRSVNNNYSDCDLRFGTFEVKSKFNYDSSVFDLVERILSNSKVSLNHPELFEGLLKNYHSEKSSFYITLGDNKIGFSGNSRFGIFSNDKDLTKMDYSNILVKIDLKDFKSKILNKQDLSEEENHLKQLFELFENTLNILCLDEVGLDTMIEYKNRHKEDPTNKLFGNYLDNFVRVSLRVLEAADLARLASEQGLNLKDYIQKENSKYSGLYKAVMQDSDLLSIFEFQGPKLYFVITNLLNQGLINYVRTNLSIKGLSSKSTSRNKSGETVANFTISRLGSLLHLRIFDLKEEKSHSANLLFVLKPNLLTTDPIVDSEITDLLGNVKSVEKMSPAELIQHAILDKFYLNYIRNDKVLILPTTYADKKLFLNYFIKLDDGLELMSPKLKTKVEELFEKTIKEFHTQLFIESLLKIQKLAKFKGLDFNNTSGADMWLQTLTPDELLTIVKEYNEFYPNEPIELEKDKDYRKVGGKCSINEVSYWYSKYFSADFLKDQLNAFVKDLKSYNVTFKVFDFKEDLESWILGGEKSEKKMTYLQKILHNKKLLKDEEARLNFAENWISDSGELILLKENGETNPFIESFFYVESLYSLNLRLIMFGSESNHEDKSYSIFQLLISLKSEYLSAAEENKPIIKSKITLLLNVEDISNFDNFLSKVTTLYAIDLIEDSDEHYSILHNLYEQSTTSITNTSQVTQTKRNVIGSATSVKMNQGLINGVSEKVLVACIDDEVTPVNTLRHSDKIDSSDGSARLSPIQEICENNSLGDHKVGIARKPIWDDLTKGSEFLAKYAVYGMNNISLQQSLLNKTSDYRMFKKMHNLRWNGSINLTHSIYDRESKNMDLEGITEWFQTVILDNKKLFYKNQYNQTVEIVDFGFDNSTYYTIEKSGGTETKVYHYFDDSSTHYTTRPEGPHHTIDSLYELFIALGGPYCVENNEVSDFSLLVLTNFVNNVGYSLPETRQTINGKKEPIYLAQHVVQPLKEKFIAYVFNRTSVKEGAKNMNPAKRWNDDEALSTFTLRTTGLGILLNAGKDATDGTLSEFSQVIAACAAYGKEFESTSELFNSLAHSAFEASLDELEYIDNFLKNYTKDPEKAKYKLYLIVGKLIVKQASNSELDLTNALKPLLKQFLNLLKDTAEKDDLKVSFSDPSLYTQFITAITSIINKKSIKRKHPGLGYIMAPSFNIIQYFLIFNPKTKTYNKYLFLDVLKMAQLLLLRELREKLTALGIEQIGTNKVSFATLQQLITTAKEKNILDDRLNLFTSDIAVSNKNLVLYYLSLQYEPRRSKEYFNPTDLVIVKVGNQLTKWDLSKIETYYEFINTEFDPSAEFYMDPTSSNNLRPSLLRWRYDDSLKIEELKQLGIDIKYDDNTKTYTIGNNDAVCVKNGSVWDVIINNYDINILKAVASIIPMGDYVNNSALLNFGFEEENGSFIKVGKYMNIFQHEIISANWNKPKNERPRQSKIQEVLDNIDKGFFIKDGKQFNIIEGSIENEEAELILGNMYKNALGIGNESLSEVLAKGEDYFKNNVEVIKGPVGRHSLIMTAEDNKHLLISFNLGGGDDVFKGDTYTRIEDPFDFSGYSKVDPDNPNVEEVYTKKGGIKIGRFVKRTNWTYKDGHFKDENNEIVDEGRYKKVKVGNTYEAWEKFEYLKRYKYDCPASVRGEYLVISHKLYDFVHEDDIARSFNPDLWNKLNVDERQKLKDSASNLIASILKNIYNNGKYLNVLVNHSNPALHNNTKHLKTLSIYLKKLGDYSVREGDTWRDLTDDEIKEKSLFERHVIETRKMLNSGFDTQAYDELLLSYYTALNNPHKKWVSFLESLKFIASRIPAQSLLSFMAMKCVGWTGTTDNIAYVSYIQTFLQGSDY